MLQRYQFAVPPCKAYHLYAALLSLAPPDFAAQAHTAHITPVAQYVSGGRWVVSLLGSPCVQTLAPLLDNLQSMPLHSGSLPVHLLKVDTVTEVEQLLDNPPAKTGILQLHTPTAFKSGGRYQLLPSPHFVMQNLVLRWNACLGQDCPLEITPQGLQALEEGLVYSAVELHSAPYPLKGKSIPGVTGTLDVEIGLQGVHAAVAQALLRFAGFAGVGIKTTLGMGGAAWLPTLK